jgi:FkbH-like protein
MNQTEIFKAARGLFKEGQGEKALALLKDALRRETFDAEGVERAGRMIRSHWFAQTQHVPAPPKVLLLGQFTTSWLVTTLTGVAWGRGVKTLVTEGGYDTIIQDLSALSPGDGSPDVVVLLPWNQRLLGGSGSPSERIGREMEFWNQAWSLVRGRLGARLLQVGYDWVTPGALGHFQGGADSGHVGLIRAMNEALRRQLPPGAFFLDLEQVTGEMGRSSFYDPRRYYWTKQPFGERGSRALSEHLWAGIRALTTGPKKVLVLDLDNTLWGGVVGETGPLGIALGESADGEAYRAFQKYVADLAAQGVVLALASKNNFNDAIEPFEKNPEMVLKLGQIAAMEINWDPKGTTIARLAKTLNLGLDSFVFFDDNPAEREQVRQAIPEVEVVEVPADPSEYIRALEAGGWFETTGLTDADLMRSSQYAVERQRRELEQTAESLDDYLRSLEMVGEVGPIDEPELQRVVQLLAKTNQFNLTTRRHSRDEVLALLSQKNAIGLTFRLKDRFGDHGLIAVVIGVPDQDDGDQTLRIDTWLMSCRVINRTAEQFTFQVILEKARRLGYRRIVGEYIPTAKNPLVKDLYASLGFERIREGPEGSVYYEVVTDKALPPVTFVTWDGEGQ